MKDYREMARRVLERRDRYLRARKRRLKLLRRTTLSAVLCFAVVLAGLGMWYGHTWLVPERTSGKTSEAVLDGAYCTMESTDVQGAYGTGAETPSVSKEPALTLPENALSVQPPDQPFPEAPELGKLSERAGRLYGGMYLRDSRITVVITEDTLENRQLLCRELGFEDSSVEFVPGKYSLSYLSGLHEKISSGMVDRSFSFVVTSGVYEMENQVVITVTTRDQALVDQVLALDTLGGAIRAEYGQAPVIDRPLAN